MNKADWPENALAGLLPRYRLLERHLKDCWSLSNVKSGTRKTAWGTLDKWTPIEFRDSIGRKRGTAAWMIFVCKNPTCPARLAVCQDDLLFQMPDGHSDE